MTNLDYEVQTAYDDVYGNDIRKEIYDCMVP